MRANEVAELVNRLTSTWPLGVRGHVWTDELAKLADYERARTVVELLTISDEPPPSVARFLAVYRSLERPAGWERPEDTGPPVAPAAYRAGVERRAAAGDPAAIAELEVWRRNRANRVTAALERHPTARAAEAP